MLRSLILLVILALAACDSPTPAVSGWDRATVAAGGMTFGVHWNGERAEAYRTSRRWRPPWEEVRANAAVAIEQASGCRVRPGSLAGDVAIVKAAITCPAAGA